MKLFVYSMREYDELAFLRSSVGNTVWNSGIRHRHRALKM